MVVENNRVERFRDSTRALLVRALAMGDVVYSQTQLLLPPQISRRNDSIAYVISTLTLCLRSFGQLFRFLALAAVLYERVVHILPLRLYPCLRPLKSSPNAIARCLSR